MDAQDEGTRANGGSEDGGGIGNGLPPVAVEEDMTLADAAGLEEARSTMVDWAQDQLMAMPEEMGVDEAEGAARQLITRSQLHEDGKWISRFLLGELARRVKAGASHGTVMDKLNEISEKYGINVNTLRYAMGCAKQFDGNILKFDKWLRSGGYQKRWKDIKTVVRENLSFEEYGAEGLADEVVRIVEGAAEEVDQVNQKVSEQKALDEDYDGATHTLGREAAKFRDESLGALEDAEGDQEEKREHALKMFVEMVRQMDCANCGKPANPDMNEPSSDPHHVAASITGGKQNDWARIPLCRECHTDLEDSQFRDWQRRTGISITAELAKVFHYWITGEKLQLPTVLAVYQWQ